MQRLGPRGENPAIRARLLLASLLVLGVLAAPATASLDGPPVLVASGLDTPWDVVPLADGRTFVTERPGRIRLITPGGTLQEEPAYVDPTARKFLGLEPDPRVAGNGRLSLYVSRPGGSSVVRLRDEGTRLALDGVVFPGPIGTDGNHDGGRVAFGPDGMLYVTTGDVHDPARPQDRRSLNGKVLRMAPDGSVPPDNPFAGEGGNAAYVWSLGHRHPQGLAWDDRGRLWESEHGTTGEQHDPDLYPGGFQRCCRDELNLIVRGGNYGWPVVSGDDERPGMIGPVAQAGTRAPWAPGGLAFAGDGKLHAPLLAGQRLLAFTPDAADGVAAPDALFPGARLRAARYDPCRGALWFTADGTDATVQRVAVGLEGRPAPPCGEPPAPAAPQASSPLAPPAAGTSPVGAAAPVPASAAPRLLAGAVAAVRAVGAARLARGDRVLLRGDGFGPGRLTVRLGLRHGTAFGGSPRPRAA